MNDLIERQKAIDALDEQITQCDKALGSFDISMKDEYAVKVERASLCAYKEILEDLPPAQPEARAQMSSADLISRQETIDAVEESRRLNHHQDGKVACAHEYEHRHFLKILRDLPSAQPDIPDTNVGNCPYCHEDSDGFVFPIEKNGHACVWHDVDGWVISLKAKGWRGSCHIKFCPMCGRRLKHG